MINVNKLFANIMLIAFVAGMLVTGLALYSVGISGIASWVVGAIVGVYCMTFVGSTQIARTKGVMVRK